MMLFFVVVVVVCICFLDVCVCDLWFLTRVTAGNTARYL